MNLLPKFSQSVIGRAITSIALYLVFSIVFVEMFYALSSLLSPSDRQFRLLPLDYVFLFHRFGYNTGYATVKPIFEWITWFFWVIFWCSVIYVRIYSLQKHKKFIYLHWGIVFGGSLALSLLNSILLGNNGPDFFNIYYSGIIYYNIQYAIATMFVPLRFVTSGAVT